MSEPSAPLALAPVVVNGRSDFRKTHLVLYLVLMIFAFMNIGLGLNFVLGVAGVLPSPTFPIWEIPYALWGGVFLALGIAQIVFLNFWRRRDAVRVMMGLDVFYMLILMAGTSEPAIDDKGSLTLPVFCLGKAAVMMALLLEPYINVLTARLDGPDE